MQLGGEIHLIKADFKVKKKLEKKKWFYIAMLSHRNINEPHTFLNFLVATLKKIGEVNLKNIKI